MRWAKWAAVFVASWCAVAGAAACTNHHNQPPDVDAWLARGKLFLTEGDGARAYLAFQQALGYQPWNLEPQYGVVLADVLQFNDTFALIFSMFSSPAATNVTAEEASEVCQKLEQCGVLADVGLTYSTCLSDGGYDYSQTTIDCIVASPDCATLKTRCLALTLPPDQKTCDDACIRFSSCGFTTLTPAACAASCPQLFTESELQCFLARQSDCQGARGACFGFFGATTDQVISQFWRPIYNEMAQDINNVAGDADFQFDLSYYTFDLLDNVFVPVFSGIHDQITLTFFAGIAAAMDSIFEMAQGLDLDVNPQVFADYAQLFTGGFAGTAGEPTFLAFLQQLDDFIVLVLDDPIYYDGLKLAQDGAPYLQYAGEEIGGLLGNWASGIDAVRKNNENQTDRVIHYVDANGDGKWDGSEPLVVPGVAELDFELAFIVHDLMIALEVSIADGYPFHVSDLAPLFDYLQYPSLALYVRALEFEGEGRLDLGQPFLDPSPDGLRPALRQIHNLIQKIETNADQLQR